MEMPEVKSFNAELSGLYDNKPPISKAKMSAITKGAIKAIKFYKHVVHSVEKFIQKCKPEYKVPGLYVIDSIVRQSRHQFGQEKDVFAPRFAKNMQQTFANLFRCPPEDKRNIIRVLNLWQKNNVFTSQVIQPLLDMADPNHPLHQEIQQQQNNTANGSSLNLSHNTSDNKLSPGPSQHSPPMSSPMDGNQFQDEPSGPPNMKFNRKLLNDFEYESEDEPMMLDPPLPTSHSGHTSHSTHTSHSHSHTSHSNTQQQGSNPTDAMASILTNPEIMRQLQSLQAQMSLMTGMQIPSLMPMMSDIQLPQNQNQPGLPFLSNQDQQNDAKDEMANESDIEFVDAGPQVIEIPDANDSRSPSPKSRRRRSRSKSPRGRRGRRSRSRSPRRRRDTTRDRERERDREKERDRDKGKDYKEREADREKQKEREKKGLPPIKKENLSVCSTTLWVGHLSKLATPEELSDLFGAHGGVVSIDVVAPRGCAFVVMERRRDAYKALNKLNKHKLHSKEITVAWAPGKGVKGREWKEQWEAELGVSYLPWTSLHARWALGELQLDALEDGGMVDEETLPPWLPPRIMPKSMMENMSLLGMPPGMISLPPGLPPPMRPQMPPDMSGGALGSPANMSVPRMPPPGMGGVLPPGMPPGLPPGIRPPNMPPGLPGLGGDGGMPPGSMIRFPPGMPPQGMGQPGMVPGFLPGLLGVGGMGNMGMPNMAAMPNMPMFAPVIPQHAPPSIQMPQRPNEGNDDDAMDLDTEDMHQEEANGDNTDNLPPALLPDQIQALLSKPPPKFNASEPPPGFNASEPPPFPQQQQTTDDKQDDERKRSEGDRERDRRDRDRRGERRDRDNRRGNDRGNERGIDRGNERGIDRGNERGNDRGNERGNDRGIERGNDRGIERGNERGLERGNDRGIDRGNERGIDRGNERGIDRGNERGIDRGNERGIDRGNDRGNDRGIERGNERSSERGIDRGNERGIDRGNERGNERPNDRRDRGNERDRDGGRDDRRDRDRGRDRRDRDRDRGANRDNNGDRNREKSPRQPSVPETTEKSLQERLWEMANGKPPPTLRQDDKPRDEYPEGRDDREAERMRPADNERSSGGGGGGGGAPGEGGEAWGPHSRPPPHLAPPFRPDMRMRGPPKEPMQGGPWMDGPPGPPGPFGPRFNGMGPPFNRPPFERPPFDGRPPFDRPPFRMPFDMGMNRPPFDGPRAHFDGPRPPFEGMRPPFAGPRPAYDGPRPAYDGPRPAYDGPRPAYDGPRAAYDGPPPADGFDRGNRRFEEREQFPPAPAPPGGGAAWGGERREWDERRRPRDERARDTRRPPRDQRDQRDQRAPHRDNRAPGNEERAPRRDDRHRDEPPPEDWSDVDRVAPVLSAPRDERPAPDKPAPRDERKDAAREERRRERQDRKSRWGGDAEDEPNPEPDVPVVVPDEIILKLQETIARFPQSESESESLNAKKESEPLPPTEPTPAGDGEGAAPSLEPMDLPMEDKVSPPKDDFQATELSKEGNCLENVEPELPEEKDFEPEKFPLSEREDLELPPMDSSPNNTQQSFESESTKHSFEIATSQQNVEAESAFVAMETEPEKLVADLYDDSATDVGIDTSFANPLPEEMIAKLDPPTLTLSTDDIFEKEATSDNDNTSDSKGA